MARNTDLTPKNSLRVVDVETLNPVESTGQPAIDSNDRLEISVNDAFRAVFLRGKNDAIGGDLIPALVSGMVNPLDFVVFFDDFVTGNKDDTTGLTTGWATVADAGATLINGDHTDGAGGFYQIACDGDDNDEAYNSSRSEAFKFAADKPALFLCRVKHTAGSTAGKGSFVIGLSDTVGANSIVDAGTLMTSFDGAVFFKGEDNANIEFVGSNATTQDNDDLVAFTNGGTYTLVFAFDPGDGTTGTLTPFYNSSGGSTLTAGTTQNITLAGLEEMHILFGVKTHEAAEQALLVDYIGVIQAR